MALSVAFETCLDMCLLIPNGRKADTSGRRYCTRFGEQLVLLMAMATAFGTLGAAARLAQPLASARSSAVPAPHVMLIVLENQSYSDIVGNRDAPFMNKLERHYETATNSYGIGHYSLDNYLAILSGTFYPWSTDDCSAGPGCQTTSPTFPGQLDAAHVTWRAFMGAMPTNCSRDDTKGGYAVRHDPFVYFPRLIRAHCSWVEPASKMLAELNGSAPPDFVWFSPSICFDGGGDESCSTIARADAFLALELPRIEATRWYADNGTIILTFDEGDANGQGAGEFLHGAGNHVLTIVISDATRGAGRYTSYVNHFGLLAGLENRFGVSCLAQACSSSNGRLPIS